MADPFTLTATCIGLLGSITKLSKDLTSFVLIAREARRDIDGFARELQSMALCVETLRDEKFPFPDTLKAQLASVLKNCDAVTRDMKQIIQRKSKHQHRPGASDTGASVGFSTKVKWSFNDRDDVVRLRERLEAHKAVLDITLDLANLTAVSDIKEDTLDIKAELAALRMQVLQMRVADNGPTMLQRFLDESLAYTESIVDPFEDDYVRSMAETETLDEDPQKDDPFVDPSVSVTESALDADDMIDLVARTVTPPDQPSTLGIINSNHRLDFITDISNSGMDKEVFGSSLSSSSTGSVSIGSRSSSEPSVEVALTRAIVTLDEDACARLLEQVTSLPSRLASAELLATPPGRAADHISILRLLASHGHKPDYSTVVLEYMLLDRVNFPASLAVIEYFASCGADLNAGLTPELRQKMKWTSSWPAPGSTVIHLAAVVERMTSWIPRLAELGADLNTSDAGRVRPLQTAAHFDNAPAIKALISAGAECHPLLPQHIVDVARSKLLRSLARGTRLSTTVAARHDLRNNQPWQMHSHREDAVCDTHCRRIRKLLKVNSRLVSKYQEEMLDALSPHTEDTSVELDVNRPLTFQQFGDMQPFLTPPQLVPARLKPAQGRPNSRRDRQPGC